MQPQGALHGAAGAAPGGMRQPTNGAALPPGMDERTPRASRWPWPPCPIRWQVCAADASAAAILAAHATLSGGGGGCGQRTRPAAEVDALRWRRGRRRCKGTAALLLSCPDSQPDFLQGFLADGGGEVAPALHEGCGEEFPGGLAPTEPSWHSREAAVVRRCVSAGKEAAPCSRRSFSFLLY